MQRFEMALAHLHVANGEVVDEGGNVFDRTSYSRFKYGFAPPAIDYGVGLIDLIESQLVRHRGDRPTVIVSAPYKFVPTASHGIALAMRRELATRFVEQGIEPPVVVPFHKARTGSGSYARGTLETRLQSLSTIGLSIDRELIRGANVLVVDDIRITGSAQAKTAEFLETLEPHTIWYLHAARLDEADARSHPGIEDELNQSFRKDLTTILRDINAGEFTLNSRVLGFIMKSADEEAFATFVQHAPDAFVEQLYESTLCSGLAYVGRFPVTLNLLQQELDKRVLFPTSRTTHARLA